MYLLAAKVGGIVGILVVLNGERTGVGNEGRKRI